MAEFERITSGFTADVEKYDEKNIIKIYRDYVPQADIDREILCTTCVQNKGLPVPEYGGYTMYEGKRAILLEYIEGDSMMNVLSSGDATPKELADDFADIHYRMHQCSAEGLEKGKLRLERLLRLSEPNLGADLTGRILRLLDTLPEGESLCHNDFHPGNMIYNSRGMFAIDWSDATSSNALADVARTVQMFDYGMNVQPDKMSRESIEKWERIGDRVRQFNRFYEEEYARLSGITLAEFRRICLPWKVVVSASRFNIEWDCNKAGLLKLFYDFFAANSDKK